MKKFLVLALLLALAGVAGISADVRTEPIDVIVALDKSLSMVDKIGAVEEYVNTYIIDQLLIPGDYFLVVAFYGKTEIPVAMRITGEADKQKAKQAISRLVGDGRFTDIGNALDVLGTELAKLPDQNRRKHLLLITDGIQEAPPASRYYSRDGKFTHEFLENTKTIQKKGWKIEILGIGTHAGASELAESLAAGYTELSEAPTAQEFIEKTRGFLASVEITEGPALSAVQRSGPGPAPTLGLTSRGHEQPVTLELSGIRLSLPGAAGAGHPARAPAADRRSRRPAGGLPAAAAAAQAACRRVPRRNPLPLHRGEPVHSRCHAGRLSGKIPSGRAAVQLPAEPPVLAAGRGGAGAAGGLAAGAPAGPPRQGEVALPPDGGRPQARAGRQGVDASSRARPFFWRRRKARWKLPVRRALPAWPGSPRSAAGCA